MAITLTKEPIVRQDLARTDEDRDFLLRTLGVDHAADRLEHAVIGGVPVLYGDDWAGAVAFLRDVAHEMREAAGE